MWEACSSALQYLVGWEDDSCIKDYVNLDILFKKEKKALSVILFLISFNFSGLNEILCGRHLPKLEQFEFLMPSININSTLLQYQF